jgi:hypothetical protein
LLSRFFALPSQGGFRFAFARRSLQRFIKLTCLFCFVNPFSKLVFNLFDACC